MYKQHLVFNAMIYFVRAPKSSKLLNLPLCFCFCLTKSIMSKDEVTTQCFWGNEKHLRVATSLVLKIINLVLNTPEKPKLQGEAEMSKVSSYCGFTFHSFEKRVPSSGGQRVTF